MFNKKAKDLLHGKIYPSDVSGIVLILVSVFHCIASFDCITLFLIIQSQLFIYDASSFKYRMIMNKFKKFFQVVRVHIVVSIVIKLDVPATRPESDALSKDLKKKGFTFVGSTIMYAYMQACGLVNDHLTSCFRHSELTS